MNGMSVESQIAFLKWNLSRSPFLLSFRLFIDLVHTKQSAIAHSRYVPRTPHLLRPGVAHTTGAADMVYSSFLALKLHVGSKLMGSFLRPVFATGMPRALLYRPIERDNEGIAEGIEGIAYQGRDH